MGVGHDGAGNADIVPLPLAGWHLLGDVRGGGRVLRATWHPDRGFVVLSVWRGPSCIATVRLAPDEAATLAGILLDRPGGLPVPGAELPTEILATSADVEDGPVPGSRHEG